MQSICRVGSLTLYSDLVNRSRPEASRDCPGMGAQGQECLVRDKRFLRPGQYVSEVGV